MSVSISGFQVGLAVAMVLAGLIFGTFYFAVLKRSAVLFTSGGGWQRSLALTVGRLSAAGVVLALVAKLGAMQLLAVFTGFLIARALALRAARAGG